MMVKKKPEDAKAALESILAQKVSNPEDFLWLDDLSFTAEQRANLTVEDLFWAQLVFKSLNGDMKATQEILDRRFGKAPQHIVQETHIHTYTNFLDTIAETVDIEARDLQTSKTIDLPQIKKQESIADRGSSIDTLLDDLGL